MSLPAEAELGSAGVGGAGLLPLSSLVRAASTSAWSGEAGGLVSTGFPSESGDARKAVIEAGPTFSGSGFSADPGCSVLSPLR